MDKDDIGDDDEVGSVSVVQQLFEYLINVLVTCFALVDTISC